MNKKFILQLLSLTFSMGLYSQEIFSSSAEAKVYDAVFLKEGKIWNYNLHHFKEVVSNGQVDYKEIITPFTCYFNGDTIVGGLTGKKLYKDEEGKAEFLKILVEEDGKIFEIKKTDGRTAQKEILYDFTLKDGEDFWEVYGFYQLDTGGDYCRMGVTDTIATNGLLLKRCFIRDVQGLYWIYGVGGPDGILSPGFPTQLSTTGTIYDYHEFVACYDDGRIVFTAQDYSYLLGIKQEIVPVNINGGPYDLQGRKMKNEKVKSKNDRALPKGIYIVNGKKVVIK